MTDNPETSEDTGWTRPRKGFAIVNAGGIMVETVSPTRAAAIVNWLVVAKKMVVQAHASEEDIYRAWEHMRDSGTVVASVTVVFDRVHP